MGTTNARFLLGILVGLVCGGGAVFWIIGGPADAVVELDDSAPSRDAGAASDEISASTVLSPPTTSAARRQVAPIPAAAPLSAERAAELAARIDVAPVERASGNGAIWGRVVDESGAGVPGVVVRARRLLMSRSATDVDEVGGPVPEPEHLEEVIRKAAERFEEERANLREATSDASGDYRIAELPEANWSLQAFREGYEVTPDIKSSRIMTDTEVGLTAKRVLQIPVEVVEADGTLASLAALQCRPQGERFRGKRYEWTPARPYLRITAGTYDVQAHSTEVMTNGDAERSSDSQQVVVSATEPAEPLRFQLGGRTGIRGRVRVAKGDVVKDRLAVSLLALAPDQAVAVELLQRSDQRSFVGIGEEFSFTDLAPGRYVIGTSRDFSTPIAVYREVTVTTKMEVCDLELPPIDYSSCLTVTALDEAGAVVNGLSLYVSGPSARYNNYFRLIESLRSVDGAYIVEFESALRDVYFGSERTTEKFVLHTHHETLGERQFELTPGTRELTVTIATPGSLTVTILGYRGSGYEGRLDVDCTQREESSGRQSRFNRATVDSQGVCKHSGLEPGPYRIDLQLRPEGGATNYSSTRTIDSLELDVRVGENEAVLNIPALYDLRVRWVDGKEAARLWLESQDDANWRRLAAELDADGLAVFTNLPAGDYFLVGGTGRGSSRMPITVPSELVDFVPQAVDCLRVQIDDASGDYAKIGLQTGDLIIGVDGVEFDGAPAIGLFGELYSSKSASLNLLVERAGKRIELSVRGSQVGGWNDRGGELVPAKR